MRRSLRVLKSNQFTNIMSENTRVSGEYTIVYYKPNEQLRVGITTSKKVSKLAVERNLIRRRIRSIIRDNENLLPPGFFIIIVKQPTLDAPYTKLSKEICKLMSKVQRKNNENTQPN